MDWSGLPLDVLIEFAVRLTVADWLNFGVVCTAWKRAAETASSSGLRPKHEPPWLMLPGGGTDLAVADFVSLSDGRRRSAALPKPAIQTRAWFGSTKGWLVTLDDECTLHLLNPITGAQLPLPSISTMGYFQVLPRNECSKVFRVVHDERSFRAIHRLRLDQRHLSASPWEHPADDFLVYFVRRAVASWDPVTAEYFVMMIHGPSNKLVFARERDAKWVVLPSTYHYNDAILYRGHFYTVTECGLVQVWEPDGATFTPRLAAPRHEGVYDFTSYPYLRKYLAESPDGRLMIIWRECSSCRDSDEEDNDDAFTDNDARTHDDDDGYNSPHRRYNEDCDETVEPANPTVGFQVFVLDERRGGSEWTEVHDLGGATLFIGYNSTVFFFPNDETPGLLADCIYFTEDHYGYSWSRKQIKPRDMGVFDMKTSVVKPMHLFSDEHSKSWPPPIWITPCI